ncbi:MAG: disulfide bond formation protein DsbA [Alphaproteobacteria bacterium]|nr:MAG: disulfide bond formation protein DsbA [Alphaproteobacteria bacterium]
MPEAPIRISYFSDILCIWAYVAERRLQEVRECFGEKVVIDCHYISVFGDTATKIEDGWKTRDGWQGYADHVARVAERFDHIRIGGGAWTKARPASSAAPHLTLKAVQIAHPERLKLAEHCALALREAFFCQGRNIGLIDVQMEILNEHNIDPQPVIAAMKDGRAFAALCRDNDLQKNFGIEGSPSFVLNEGRQKLYGNVGFKIIEANILELLREPASEQASWC